jgi:hypothetical protein
MTDPIAAVTALAGAAKGLDPDSKTAELGVSLWSKVLGPPAEAFGQHLGRKVEQWSENQGAKRVLELAAQKTDTSIPGSVPPRAAAAVFNAAEFSDDEFVAEYLSGVLAAGRSLDGTDDSGVEWAALVARLPSDALKMHYIVYSILRRKMVGEEVDVVHSWCKKYLVFSYYDINLATDFIFGPAVSRRALDALYTLQREGLIGELTHGGADHLVGYPFGSYQLPQTGDVVILTTTIQGIQLYLQGHGHGGVWASAIADTERDFQVAGSISEGMAMVAGSFLEELPPKVTSP